MADRRPLRFDNLDAIIDDVRRLRAGREKHGEWTLAQACWHLKLALDHCLTMPADIEPTPAEGKMQERLQQMFAAGGMPPGLPIAPGTEPPADAGDDSIDGFLAGLERLKKYEHSHVSFGPFGPVPTGQFRAFIEFHAANHLSTFRPIGPSAIERRAGVRFADGNAMIADIERLRSGYRRAGRWTLPQIAWHLCLGYPRPIQPLATMPELAEAQRTRQQRWDYYIANGHPPYGFEAPAEMMPPADLGDAEIEKLIATLRELDAVDAPFVVAAAGAMPIARARGFILAHGAHHLTYLVPSVGRRKLRFANFDELRAEIGRLQGGHTQSGNWSLAQACYHLEQTMAIAMRPGPYEANTPEQDGRKEILANVMRTGEIPAGLVSPAFADPPIDTPASAVEGYLTTIDRFLAHPGEYAPHRLFGNLSREDRRTHQLFHAAHHLSYLTPTSQK